MVLVGLLPLLALASTSSVVSGMPIDSPPASPALSLQGSATFSPVPTFSPQLSIPSPTLPSTTTFPIQSAAGDTEYNLSSLNPNSKGGSANADANANAHGSDNGHGSAEGNAALRGGGVGRGKGMTNAERIRRGLGLAPPTRRMTSKPARRSAKPVVDAAQADDQPQNQDQNHTFADAPTDDGGANNSGNNDGDIAQPGNGQTLASKRYVMRMKNPEDGSDMGVVTVPKDGSSLIGYDDPSSGSNPLTTQFPNDPTSTPFNIAPANSNPSNTNGGDGSGNGDDDSFSGPRKLLAAVPHRSNASGGNGDLTQGQGDYANLGMGWTNSAGLLHINIQALLGSGPGASDALGPLTNLPVGDSDSDPTSFIKPAQLLSRPGSGLPIDPSSITSSTPLSQGLSDGGDPTHLLHAGITNLPDLLNGSGPINGLEGVGGDPQSTLWTFHPQSSRLLAHYVNSDGNTVPTYFVTGGECSHTLCLTADVEAFKREQGDEAHEVHVLAEAVADL